MLPQQTVASMEEKEIEMISMPLAVPGSVPVAIDTLPTITPTTPTTIKNKQDSSSTVVEDNPKTPNNHKRRMIGKYEIGITIGQGSSGKVKLAIHSETKEKCVVKAIKRPKTANGKTVHQGIQVNDMLREKVYKRELYMIREAFLGCTLDHKNIVKLLATDLGENHFYCVFEYVDGQDLVDFITKQGKLSEQISRSIFRQVISAIDYAHRNHVVHRDIKLENIRYNSVTGLVKILDFGFASFYTDFQPLKTNCGSPCYAAPEIYDNVPYDGTLIDVWSLGICLYGMVVGCLPFDGSDFKSLATKVRLGRIEYPKSLSSSIVELLSGMLNINPKKRWLLSQVIRDKWVNYQCSEYPVDYQDQVQVISQEWVQQVSSTTLHETGNSLYDLVKSKTKVTGPEEVTDEDSNGEQDAAKVLSQMTVKERIGGKIWWKKIWNQMSRAFVGKEDVGVNSMRVSISRVMPQVVRERAKPHARMGTDTFQPIPEVKNHKRYRFWGAGRR